MTTTLDPKSFILDEWVPALLSDEFEQGTGSLKTAEGNFCCLGVAAKCLARNHSTWLIENNFRVHEDSDSMTVFDHRDGTEEIGILPYRLGAILGLNTNRFSQGNLATPNDSGATFVEIANVLVPLANGDREPLRDLQRKYPE